ncbi:MAG: hypothetical protein SXQ77_06065, partial [Halobacteria archaeon]|nr:hypothetical protein [Halobacteria archaeon]
RHVSEDVIGQVDIETAVATASIDEGERVSLSMQDGMLRATPTHPTTRESGTQSESDIRSDTRSDTRDATAVAVTSADEGEDVGVTDFEGILDYEPGKVTIVSVPRVQNGGSRSVDSKTVSEHSEGKLVATAGVEALATVKAAGLEPNIRFGTVEAVHEAATKGLDVLLVCVSDELSAHTDKLRQQNVSYEVLDTV